MSEKATVDLPRHPAAPKTPAERVAELTGEVTRLEQRLGEVTAQSARQARDYARWHEMRSTSFGGIPMAQFWCDLILWESVLNENLGLRAIVEIGTWRGGLSWWLWGQCRARDMRLVTVDSVQPEQPPPGFVRLDVWRERDRLNRLIHANEPVALFCDGGNKPRELREFGLALEHPESLVLVHDWGTETLPGDVPEGLTMLYGDFCEELGGITRVFRRGSLGD